MAKDKPRQKFDSHTIEQDHRGVRRRSVRDRKDDGIRKRLAQEVGFYGNYAANLLLEQVAAIRQDVEETLDAEVRSASLVENIKITLRPLLATCRGQVAQEMLELLRPDTVK